MTSGIHLHYFIGRGIGEPVRLILTVGQVEFTDHRYTLEEFTANTALKSKLPFGQMPTLEVDGAFIGQTDSAARLAARLSNLYPANPIDAAKSDMIVVQQKEIESPMTAMVYDGVPGAPGTKLLPKSERESRVGKYVKEKVPAKLAYLENLVEGSWMVGSQISWADVCVFHRLNQMLELDEKILGSAFPKLQGVYDRVEELPQIRTWIRDHLEDYPRFIREPGSS